MKTDTANVIATMFAAGLTAVAGVAYDLNPFVVGFVGAGNYFAGFVIGYLRGGRVADVLHRCAALSPNMTLRQFLGVIEGHK